MDVNENCMEVLLSAKHNLSDVIFHYKQATKTPYQLWNLLVQINPTHKKLLYKETKYQILCCPILLRKL